MRLQRTILSKETLSQPKVIDFLESVARNSVKSKLVYGIALSHFQTFLNQKYSDSTELNLQTLETIIDAISKNQINVYILLDNFVNYLISPNRPNNLSSNSISLYVNAVRSYLQFYDIDIVPAKFKRGVRLPKNHREDEEALDVSDIRRLLLSCNNRRIKAYLLVLSSGGMRTVEAAAIRIKDLDFSVSPTRVHIRKEYAKTRVARDVYISDEATIYLKQWLEFKYRNRNWNRPKMSPDDIVFTRMHFIKPIDPRGLYIKILQEFHSLQATCKMDELKEGMNRRKITLHSFRRFVKSVISTQAGRDYSEWFLGHSKSPYWILKESERREIYAAKLMPYLTFLDYSTLEKKGENVEAISLQKEREIQILKLQELTNADAIASLADRVSALTEVVQKFKKVNEIKKSESAVY